jgi:hypothetical protein
LLRVGYAPIDDRTDFFQADVFTAANYCSLFFIAHRLTLHLPHPLNFKRSEAKFDAMCLSINHIA